MSSPVFDWAAAEDPPTQCLIGKSCGNRGQSDSNSIAAAKPSHSMPPMQCRGDILKRDDMGGRNHEHCQAARVR